MLQASSPSALRKTSAGDVEAGRGAPRRRSSADALQVQLDKFRVRLDAQAQRSHHMNKQFALVSSQSLAQRALLVELAQVGARMRDRVHARAIATNALARPN